MTDPLAPAGDDRVSVNNNNNNNMMGTFGCETIYHISNIMLTPTSRGALIKDPLQVHYGECCRQEVL